MIPPSELAELQELEEEEQRTLVKASLCSLCQTPLTLATTSRQPALCRHCAEGQTHHPIPPSVAVLRKPHTVSTIEATTLRGDFNHAIAQLVGTLNDLTDVSHDGFVQKTPGIWGGIGQLSRSLHASAQHLDLIATLAELVAAESSAQLSGPKVEALLEAFHLLSGKAILSEAVLEDVYRILIRAGFDVAGAIKATSI